MGIPEIVWVLLSILWLRAELTKLRKRLWEEWQIKDELPFLLNKLALFFSFLNLILSVIEVLRKWVPSYIAKDVTTSWGKIR